MRVGVFGAGAIGGYLGVRLSDAGAKVTLVGRASLVEAKRELQAIDFDGRSHRPGGDLVVTTDAAALADVDACLVTVKSNDTDAAGEALAKVLKKETLVVSLQNGLRNAVRLSAALGREVVPGMVTFNVLREGSTFSRTTSGPILAGAGDRALVDAFARAGEPLGIARNIEAVQAAKLLLNLNNGLCALTGRPIAESLRSRDLRRCFSACLREGLRVLAAAARPVGRIGPLAPSVVAKLLLLPDPIFFRIARSMMAIDPRAKSSTLQDVEAGRRTEIDFLNGEIVLLAKEQGVDAPVNGFVTDSVHELELRTPKRFWEPAALWQRLSVAARD